MHDENDTVYIYIYIYYKHFRSKVWNNQDLIRLNLFDQKYSKTVILWNIITI